MRFIWSEILNWYISWDKRLWKYPSPSSNETLTGYKKDALFYNKLDYVLILLLLFFITIFIATESWIAWEVPFKVHRHIHSKQLPLSLKTIFTHYQGALGQNQPSFWQWTWLLSHLKDTSWAGAVWCSSQLAWSPYRWVWWASLGVKIQNAQCHAVQKQMCRVFHFCRPSPLSYQNSHLKVKKKKKKISLTKVSLHNFQKCIHSSCLLSYTEFFQ